MTVYDVIGKPRSDHSVKLLQRRVQRADKTQKPMTATRPCRCLLPVSSTFPLSGRQFLQARARSVISVHERSLQRQIHHVDTIAGCVASTW